MKNKYEKYYYTNQKLYSGFRVYVRTHGYNAKYDWIKLDVPYKHYRKVSWGPVISCIDNNWCYDHKWAKFFRRFAFKQDITNIVSDILEIKENQIRWKVRTRRWRDNWDDHARHTERRSWKRAHKCKKQWMVNLSI
jgi:hypothetical protein